MNTSLDLEVKAALEARRGSWKSIAAASGVSYSWISQFCRGRIPNPGHETLKRLSAVLQSQATPA